MWSSSGSTEAICGAAFLEGPQWGNLQGLLAVAALKGSKLLLMRLDEQGTVVEVGQLPALDGAHGRLRAVRPGPDGALYVTTRNGDDDEHFVTNRRVDAMNRQEFGAPRVLSRGVTMSLENIASSPSLPSVTDTAASRDATAAKWRSVTMTRQVPKPWGREEHFALVAGKYPVLRQAALHHGRSGAVTAAPSIQYKDETIALQSGRLLIEIGGSIDNLDTFELVPGETIRIRPGVVHRMSALTDAVVLETSTTELEDVVRIEDRYGRAGSMIP